MGKHKKNLSAGNGGSDGSAGNGAQEYKESGGQQERDYQAAALYLAQNYGNMLKEKGKQSGNRINRGFMAFLLKENVRMATQADIDSL